mmetsp:Transcript_2195/g.3687  ORF Transcript_2195/g.3687 Transcript_2195/m.3687 type:complete len:225 (+) Transcript_2195:46-720(+)
MGNCVGAGGVANHSQKDRRSEQTIKLEICHDVYDDCHDELSVHSDISCTSSEIATGHVIVVDHNSYVYLRKLDSIMEKVLSDVEAAEKKLANVEASVEQATRTVNRCQDRLFQVRKQMLFAGASPTTEDEIGKTHQPQQQQLKDDTNKLRTAKVHLDGANFKKEKLKQDLASLTIVKMKLQRRIARERDSIIMSQCFGLDPMLCRRSFALGQDVGIATLPTALE